MSQPNGTVSAMIESNRIARQVVGYINARNQERSWDWADGDDQDGLDLVTPIYQLPDLRLFLVDYWVRRDWINTPASDAVEMVRLTLRYVYDDTSDVYLESCVRRLRRGFHPFWFFPSGPINGTPMFNIMIEQNRRDPVFPEARGVKCSPNGGNGELKSYCDIRDTFNSDVVRRLPYVSVDELVLAVNELGIEVICLPEIEQILNRMPSVENGRLCYTCGISPGDLGDALSRFHDLKDTNRPFMIDYDQSLIRLTFDDAISDLEMNEPAPAISISFDEDVAQWLRRQFISDQSIHHLIKLMFRLDKKHARRRTGLSMLTSLNNELRFDRQTLDYVSMSEYAPIEDEVDADSDDTESAPPTSGYGRALGFCIRHPPPPLSLSIPRSSRRRVDERFDLGAVWDSAVSSARTNRSRLSVSTGAGSTNAGRVALIERTLELAR